MAGKILLIQIRRNPSVKKEELESFARYSNLQTKDFEVFDVFHDDFNSIKLQNYRCIYIGGASEASVLEPKTYTFVPELIELTKNMIADKIPTFASCFGFQIAVLALGGTITRDTEKFEMGTLPIQITEDAMNDQVYKGIPNGFYAVSVHQEMTNELPNNCKLLARTDHCIHSFKVIDSPFWAFQFHPELDKPTLTERLNAYKEKYTEDIEHFNQVIDSFKETPFSNKLVLNFINSIS